MRYSRLLGALVLAVLVFMAGFVVGEAPEQRSHVEEEVRALFDRYVVARNSFNSDAFLMFYLNSGQLTVISPMQEYIGLDRLRRSIAPIFEARTPSIEVTDVRVLPLNRNLAVVHHHYSLKTSKGLSNPAMSTKVFYRTPDGWKIVAEHSSRIRDFVGR